MLEQFSLQGRTALVTGASSGIGRAMALALAEAGALVVATGRDEKRLGQVGELTGGPVVSADLATQSGLSRLLNDVATVGDVDILVNAAGSNPRPPLGEQTVADFREVLAVNLDAAFGLGQALGPRMAERGWGRIVNVGSQQQHRAFGNSGAYGVAKAGIAGLTRSQSEAWAPYGVCCNTITPGLVATPMTAAVLADPERTSYFEGRSHVGRLGRPEDFAGVVVFLASSASDFVTGQVVCVDGGLSVT